MLIRGFRLRGSWSLLIAVTEHQTLKRGGVCLGSVHLCGEALGWIQFFYVVGSILLARVLVDEDAQEGDH